MLRQAAMLLIAAGAGIEDADARGILDAIRGYDLNDYSLGVALSVGQSPYRGASNSTIAYPYLTSFRHPAFTDDWLLLRDGDIGVRWVPDSGWELGLVGRVNTLGLGDADPIAVRGLDERQWTLEAGPTVGWRGWPVHVNFKTYTELLGRRDGFPAELAVSWPVELAYGYFIPSIEAVYQSADYNRHYFGVTPEEVVAGRPAYRPDSDVGWRLRLRHGRRIADHWLLAATVSWEVLGDEVAQSPLVAREHLWSVNIGMAYDVDVFQPRRHPDEGRRATPFELRVGAFVDTVDTDVRRASGTGATRSAVDAEDALGASDTDTLLQVDARYRIGTYHRLQASYFSFGRRSTATLTEDTGFGNLELPAGSEVDVRVDLATAMLTYGYSLMRDAQKELALTIGLHSSASTIALRTVSGGADAVRTRSLLPVIGASGSVALGSSMQLAATLQFFRMDFDRYEGNLNYANLDMSRRLGQHWSAGVGLNYYGMKLSSSADALRGTLHVRHYGPLIYVGANF